jgi:phosphohistidine phosphatase
MDLYILRHAIAVQRGTKDFDDDSQRPLTKEGKQKMYDIARGMRSLGITFDVLLSSPFVRARETAEIVTEVFDVKKKLKFTDTLAVGGNPEELVEEILEQFGSMESIMLVGHEPYLSEFISTLIAGDSRVPITMKKGGLCKLSVSMLRYGRCATLEWLLAPRHLVRIR